VIFAVSCGRLPSPGIFCGLLRFSGGPNGCGMSQRRQERRSGFIVRTRTLHDKNQNQYTFLECYEAVSLNKTACLFITYTEQKRVRLTNCKLTIVNLIRWCLFISFCTSQSQQVSWSLPAYHVQNHSANAVRCRSGDNSYRLILLIDIRAG